MKFSIKQQQAAKWCVAVVSICIIFYLCISNINPITHAILDFLGLFSPLLIGIILALIINIPMSIIETHLFERKAWLPGARRPLSIIVSLLLILGALAAIAFLIIPELIGALRIVMQNIIITIDALAALETSSDLSAIPHGNLLQQINIDWIALKNALEKISMPASQEIFSTVFQAFGSAASMITKGFIGLIFSIYILANKERLKSQVLRLLRVWMPHKLNKVLIHVTNVCVQTFRQFIVGQTTEAIILGVLCTIGMLLLRIPYAPMVGVTIGITAFIPVVGAYIGAIVGIFMIITMDPFKALVFAIFLVILQQVEGNIIYPKVVGSKINLPAIWVLTAITVGGSIGGPLGMLLGVPTIASVYTLVKEITVLREQQLSKS